MRRNNSRNMYGNQPGGHIQESGGPLMTNHLRDLDIELEMLKRKRDIIQQEQNILNRERFTTQRQYDYKQPSNMYSRQEPQSSQQYNDNNYSLTYGAPSYSGNYRPQGVKRPSRVDDWQAPKRFNTPKVNPWGNASEQRYAPRNSFQAPKPRYQPPTAPARAPRPLLGKTSYRPPNPTPRSNFQPANKVTKPRSQQQPPNKLATYPTQQTKELVAKTIGEKKKPLNWDHVLRADVVPPPPVKGRLELALGAIFKDLKTDHHDDMEMFTRIQKLLKEILRARIRSVMLGHQVGPVVDIVDRYRSKYPRETDKELVALAQETNLKYHELPWQLLEAADPEDFFKTNMTKLVNHKLEDMFKKIDTMYKKKESGLEKLLADLPGRIDKTENEEKAKDDKTEDKNDEKSDKTDKNDKKSEKKTKPLNADEGIEVITEKMEKVKFYVKLIDGLLEDRLPTILPKFKDLLMSTVFSERDFINTKTVIYSSFKSKYLHRLAKEQKQLLAYQKPNDIINLVDDSVAEQAKDVIVVEDDTTPGNEKETTAASATTDAAKTADETNNTSVAANTFDVANETTDVTNKTAEVTANKADTPQQTPTKAVTSQQPQTPKTPISKDILYIKLIGRPALPARAVIYEFLNKFNPASIKKHKTLSNLLVVGFKEREDFEKILAANESVVGESTLIIKSSEQQGNSNKPTPAQTPVKTPGKPQNTSADNIIPSDLDTQITDLLSAIRSSEEVNNAPKKTDGKDDAAKASDDNNDNATTNEDNDKAKATENNDNEETNEEAENNDTEMTDEAQSKGCDEKMDTTGDKKLEPIAENGEKCEGNNKIKDSTTATPTRASSRIATGTPATIRTRRASRFLQNN